MVVRNSQQRKRINDQMQRVKGSPPRTINSDALISPGVTSSNARSGVWRRSLGEVDGTSLVVDAGSEAGGHFRRVVSFVGCAS